MATRLVSSRPINPDSCSIYFSPFHTLLDPLGICCLEIWEIFAGSEGWSCRTLPATNLTYSYCTTSKSRSSKLQLLSCLLKTHWKTHCQLRSAILTMLLTMLFTMFNTRVLRRLTTEICRLWNYLKSKQLALVAHPQHRNTIRLDELPVEIILMVLDLLPNDPGVILGMACGRFREIPQYHDRTFDQSDLRRLELENFHKAMRQPGLLSPMHGQSGNTSLSTNSTKTQVLLWMQIPSISLYSSHPLKQQSRTTNEFA